MNCLFHTWSLAARSAVRDLTVSVTPAQVAITPGLLAAQVYVNHRRRLNLVLELTDLCISLFGIFWAKHV